MARRERPADGGLIWHELLHAFECLGCLEFEEMRRATYRSPERLAETKELLILDHTECWEFDDAEMAKRQRKFRKRAKMARLLAESGRGLAAQRVSWRGRA